MSLKLRFNLKGKQFSKHTDDFHRASPHNFVFLIVLFFLGCPFCVGRGRKKNYFTLWKLYMHVKLNHKNETDFFKSIIWNLADYVLRGILK